MNNGRLSRLFIETGKVLFLRRRAQDEIANYFLFGSVLKNVLDIDAQYFGIFVRKL